MYMHVYLDAKYVCYKSTHVCIESCQLYVLIDSISLYMYKLQVYTDTNVNIVCLYGICMYVCICGLVYLADNVIPSRCILCRGCDEYARYNTLHRKHNVIIRLYCTRRIYQQTS